MKNYTIALILNVIVFTMYAQTATVTDPEELHKCGIAPSNQNSPTLKNGWGYNYSNLQDDISNWQTSEFVWVKTIGKSVENRNLYMLTITDSTYTDKKYRIWIHTRTHPIEVQSEYVTNEIINQLISDDKQMSLLREQCIFNIVPMYNPDGVELDIERENANYVNLETNWAETTPQIEVQTIRNTIDSLMNSSLPINIALNMHSAYGTNRYFWFHYASGTSNTYAEMEKRFITLVKDEFPAGIKSWDFAMSWAGVAPTVYPESWFWYNHHENVLALTYEDMNDPSAGSFDITAAAITNGIGKYLNIFLSTSTNQPGSETSSIYAVKNRIHIIATNVRVKISNIQGQLLFNSRETNPSYTVPQNGIYIVTICFSNGADQYKVVVAE